MKRNQKEIGKFARIVRFSTLTVMLLAGLGVRCNPGAGGLHAPPGKVVAQVNHDRITAPQVDYAAEQMRAQVSPSNLPKLLDRMTTIALLAEEAVRRGYLKDEKVLAGLAWLERMYLANEFATRVAETIEPTPEEISAYFQNHREEFAQGLKIMLMVLPDSIIAEQTLAELQQGADFVRLARERSLDTSVLNVPGYPTRGLGLSLGWDLDEEERVFNLKPGELSPVIPTPLGYQIVKLIEKKRIVDSPSFNEITRMYISEALKAKKRQTLLDSIMNHLRENARITLKPEAYSTR